MEESVIGVEGLGGSPSLYPITDPIVRGEAAGYWARAISNYIAAGKAVDVVGARGMVDGQRIDGVECAVGEAGSYSRWCGSCSRHRRGWSGKRWKLESRGNHCILPEADRSALRGCSNRRQSQTGHFPR